MTKVILGIYLTFFRGFTQELWFAAELGNVCSIAWHGPYMKTVCGWALPGDYWPDGKLDMKDFAIFQNSLTALSP